MLKRLLRRCDLHIAERHIAGSVDQDAGEGALGRRRRHRVPVQRVKRRLDRLRRGDVAFVGADIAPLGSGDACVAGFKQLVAPGCLEGCVEDGDSGALLAQFLAYARSEAPCCRYGNSERQSISALSG